MPEKLPDHFEAFRRRHAPVVEAHQALSARCHEAGPLGERERRLAKLAIAVGTRHEGAVHSQVRQALDAKIEPDAIRQVAILAIPTLGFPAAMAALSWIEDLLARR